MPDPQFDPSKPFTVVPPPPAPSASAPTFDPSKPFTVVSPTEPAGGAMNFAIVNGRRVPIDEATGEPTPPSTLWEKANTSPIHDQLEAARQAITEYVTRPTLNEQKLDDLAPSMRLGHLWAMAKGMSAGEMSGALDVAEGFTTPVGLALTLTGLGPDSAIVKAAPALKPLLNLPAVQALRTAVHTTAGLAFAAHGAGTAAEGAGTIYDAATSATPPPEGRLARAETGAGQIAHGIFEAAGGALGAAPVAQEAAAWWAQRQRTAAGAAALDAFRKAAPPSAGAPYSDPQLRRVFPELIDEHHTTGPLTTIDEARAAADRKIAYYEKGIDDTIATNPTELITTRPLDEVRARLGPSVNKEDLAKGLKSLAPYDLDQPITVERANEIRRRLNDENAVALSKNKYDRQLARSTDPAFAAQEAAADVLRNGIADVLDTRAGVGGFTRDTRAQQGALIAVRDALQRQAWKNEARVGGTGTTSTARKIGAAFVKAAGVGGGAAIGEVFAPGTAHVGTAAGAIAGKYLADPIAAAIDRPPLTRDQLIEKAFGDTTPGQGLQTTPSGTPPPPVAPGAGPGGPGGAPGGPSAAAGPGLPPPTPPPQTPPPTPQQMAAQAYVGLLGQGYSPELAKQMAITFARDQAARRPATAARQLGTGPRFVTNAAGETVPATEAGPQIPESARPLAMPANVYQAPAVDPSRVRAVPGTYAERVDAARAAPETVAGPKALPRDPRATNYAGWTEADLHFAAENGIPSRKADAQAELARRAALPPDEAAATTPAPTGATSSSAAIADFGKMPAKALAYAAKEGTPDYRAAAQAEIARRKGAAADRATARQQTRAEADAAEQQDLADLVAKAQANGNTTDPAALHAELARRLQDIKDLHAELDDAGTNGITLLRAIAKNGGLSVQAAAADGAAGEMRALKELQDTKPSASRTNLKAPPVVDAGKVRGVGGVFREATQRQQGGFAGGQSFDSMVAKLQQDPRFAHITNADELAAAIREAATGRADSRNAIADVAASSRDLLYPPVDQSFDPATLEATPAERATVRRGGFGAGPPRPPVDPAPPPPDRPNTTRGGFGAGRPPAAPVPDVPDTPPPPASSASASSAPADLSAYLSSREYAARLRATYFKDGEKIASSRDTPQTAPIPALGTWRIDDGHAMLDGREIAQLRTVPIEQLEISEDTGAAKFGDVEQYARWIKEGKQPPPIEVIQTDRGTLKTVDHRRLLAAKAAGQDTITAWVYPATISDRPGGPTVGLTYELAQKGAAPIAETPARPEQTIFSDDAPRLATLRAKLEAEGAPPVSAVPDTPALRAFHGSPHDFAQFDASKIGTGEGAQAYGHGLYFAEKEGTARSYRDKLSPMDVTVRGVPGVTWERLTAGMSGVKKGSLDAARASGKFSPAELDAMAFMNDSNIDDTIKSMHEQAAMTWRGADARQLWTRRANVLEQLKAETTIKPSGHMYEVNIHTDPEHLLDWDLPLSQQPASIRYVLGYQPPPTPAEVDAVFADAKRRGVPPASLPEYQALQAQADAAAKMDRDYPNGAAIYNEWMHDARDLAIRQGRDPETTLPASQAAASEEFRKMGITGIRYLDQGSRGGRSPYRGDPAYLHAAESFRSDGQSAEAAAAGVRQAYANADPGEVQAAVREAYDITPQTRNYVVFDPKKIEILKKYGVLLPAAGLGVAAAGRLLTKDQPE